MDDFSQRVAIGLTIYGINDVVGDYTKRWVESPETQNIIDGSKPASSPVGRRG